MKAIRQDVEEEAAHELGNLNAHGLILSPGTSLMTPPAEADMGVVEIEQAIVRDRDAVGVLRNVG